jgi:hypothetical protein
MSLATIYTMGDIEEMTGASRPLIRFLLADRQIPLRVVGRSKVVDSDGLELLKQAIADYQSRADLVPA